jgi:hypothetical protein
MLRARTAKLRPVALVATAALAIVATVAAIAGLAVACGGHGAEPPAVPSDVHLATDETARPLSTGAVSAVTPGAAPTGADWLEAARTVMRYCALIDDGQFARAAELCARRRLWSRRACAGTTRFHFRSARIYAAPDARTLVLKARVQVRTERGRQLPDGLSVLFFTLGRAGTAVGGWLITAVSTSPQPSRKGSV